MISALALALVSQLPLSPILQPGTNRLFFEMSNNVALALKEERWRDAEVALSALPKKDIVIEWDDKAVPPAYKADYLQAREDFARDFAQQSLEWKVKFGSPGAIKISFTTEIPGNAGELRKGAAILYSPSPKEPRIESVIALKRGEPAVATEAIDVYNELGYAVLQYWGKETTPYPHDFAFRSEQPARERRKLSSQERIFMRRTAMTVDSLAESVKLKRAIEPSSPRAQYDVKEITWPPAVQGEVREFRLQISNPGNSPLMVQARPDCGCVFVEPWITIDPGQTGLLKGGIDTTEFVGQLDKKIFLSTNDVEHPMETIPVRIFAKPLFRLIQPSGLTLLADQNGASTVVYLALDPTMKLKATGVQTSGLPATAKLEPWSGSLADPEFKEPAKPRVGYRIPVQIAKGQPQGRFGVTVMVTTDNPKYPVLRHSFYVQTGIVASPTYIYFGEIRQTPRRGTVIVSRPGKPFKIMKVTTDVDYLKASFIETGLGVEYQIVGQLNGKQPTGRLADQIHIYTNDPKQPRIDIQVSAIVR